MEKNFKQDTMFKWALGTFAVIGFIVTAMGAMIPNGNITVNLGALAGDCSGAANANTVVKLQNIPVATMTPVEAQGLYYDSTKGMWVNVSASGDVARSTPGVYTVQRIQNQLVATMTPSSGQCLIWNATAGAWINTALSGNISAATPGVDYVTGAITCTTGNFSGAITASAGTFGPVTGTTGYYTNPVAIATAVTIAGTPWVPLSGISYFNSNLQTPVAVTDTRITASSKIVVTLKQANAYPSPCPIYSIQANPQAGSMTLSGCETPAPTVTPVVYWTAYQ